MVFFLRSRLNPSCGSLLCMAQSGRFGLSLRILTVLASEPATMHTSSAIAEALTESAVMVRRCFLLLHKKGLIEQRKGPHGGAKLKLPAKQIGLGDVYVATEDDWLMLENPPRRKKQKRQRSQKKGTRLPGRLRGFLPNRQRPPPPLRRRLRIRHLQL